MQDFQRIDYYDKVRFYHELRSEMGAMNSGFWLTSLANACALLMAQLPTLNWAGFYLLRNQVLVWARSKGYQLAWRLLLVKACVEPPRKTAKCCAWPMCKIFPGISPAIRTRARNS